LYQNFNFLVIFSAGTAAVLLSNRRQNKSPFLHTFGHTLRIFCQEILREIDDRRNVQKRPSKPQSAYGQRKTLRCRGSFARMTSESKMVNFESPERNERMISLQLGIEIEEVVLPWHCFLSIVSLVRVK